MQKVVSVTKMSWFRTLRVQLWVWCGNGCRGGDGMGVNAGKQVDLEKSDEESIDHQAKRALICVVKTRWRTMASTAARINMKTICLFR